MARQRDVTLGRGAEGTKQDRIEEFFGYANATKRERIFMSKLEYDLKIASARDHGYLSVYRVDVDSEGFDLILQRDLDSRRAQVKSVQHGGKAGFWEIKAGLLKPTPDEQRQWDIPALQYYHPFGVNGGVVLIEIDAASPDVRVRYYYSDLHVLMLQSEGVIGDAKSAAGARDLLKRVAASQYRTKVRMRRSAFVRARGAEALLALMGMPSRLMSNWQLWWGQYFAPARRGVPDKEALAGLLAAEFARLSCSRREHCFAP